MNTLPADSRLRRMLRYLLKRPVWHGPRCLLVLFLAATASRALRAGDALPTYRWEAEKIYRYQISKRAETVEHASGRTRITECRCVLVFEVESVNAEGHATATIRYLTPDISLPVLAAVDPSTNERTEETARTAHLARVVQTILTETNWPVTLAPDGSVRLRARPPDWRSWMRRLEQAGHWPKRVGNELGKLLDVHFTIGKEGTSDDEWLPVLRDALPDPRAKGIRAFRPRRRTETPKAQPNGLLALRLRRDPEEQPPDVQVPLLDPKGITLILSREGVKSLEGEAVFDTELGLLDSARERYQVTLASRCGVLTQRADVTVSYEMKRLDPPLRVQPTKEEDPGKDGRALAPANAP